MTGAPGSIDRATDRRTERTDGAGTPAIPGRLTSDGRHPVLVPEDWDQYLDASEWSLGDDGLPFRTAARVLVVTRDADVLLLAGHDATDPEHTWVFTPGGGLHPGENPRAGAVRELGEESGINVAPTELEGPIAHREAIFRFATVTCRQDEVFFLLRLPSARTVGGDGWTDLERDVVDSISWWSSEDLQAAQERGQEIYPVRLPSIVRELAAGWSGEPLDLTDPVDAQLLAELTDRRPPSSCTDRQGPR